MWQVLAFLGNFQEAAEEQGRGVSIAGGAVSAFERNADVLAQLAQAVAGLARNERTTQAHGAQRFARVVIAQVGKLLLQKRVVEPHVVGHEHAAFSDFHHLAGHFVKLGRVAHHVVGNARELGDERRNSSAGVEQRGVFIHNFLAVVNVNGYFGDAVLGGLAAGGFKVDDGVQSAARELVKEKTNKLSPP